MIRGNKNKIGWKRSSEVLLLGGMLFVAELYAGRGRKWMVEPKDLGRVCLSWNGWPVITGEGSVLLPAYYVKQTSPSRDRNKPERERGTTKMASRQVLKETVPELTVKLGQCKASTTFFLSFLTMPF